MVRVQRARHDADYDPFSKYTRQNVLGIITEARDAVEAFDAAPRQERLHFIAYLLASDRNPPRITRQYSNRSRIYLPLSVP